jgi:tetratricopeptide (TPR) repeat protein
LNRAVGINSFEASSWIELGLLAESAGDLETAERDLLRAAQVDRRYLPRWTLANFYLRRGDSENFWKWARAASEMIYDGSASFFRLCGQMSEDGKLIERLNLTKPDLRAQYASYLIDVGRIDLALSPLESVMRGNRPKDLDLLLAACDREIGAGFVDEATRLWNGLVETNRIHSSRVGTEVTVTKGQDFRNPVLGRGFDWRLIDINGVAPTIEDDPPGLRLGFSGGQPETCEPIYRYLPVTGSSAYGVKIGYDLSGAGPHSGLRWTVIELPGGTTLATSDEVAGVRSAETIIHFTPSPNCRLVKIALDYARTRGTTRLQGSILLREIELRKTY